MSTHAWRRRLLGMVRTIADDPRKPLSINATQNASSYSIEPKCARQRLRSCANIFTFIYRRNARETLRLQRRSQDAEKKRPSIPALASRGCLWPSTCHNLQGQVG